MDDRAWTSRSTLVVADRVLVVLGVDRPLVPPAPPPNPEGGVLLLLQQLLFVFLEMKSASKTFDHGQPIFRDTDTVRSGFLVDDLDHPHLFQL